MRTSERNEAEKRRENPESEICVRERRKCREKRKRKSEKERVRGRKKRTMRK